MLSGWVGCGAARWRRSAPLLALPHRVEDPRWTLHLLDQQRRPLAHLGQPAARRHLGRPDDVLLPLRLGLDERLPPRVASRRPHVQAIDEALVVRRGSQCARVRVDLGGERRGLHRVGLRLLRQLLLLARFTHPGDPGVLPRAEACRDVVVALESENSWEASVAGATPCQLPRGRAQRRLPAALGQLRLGRRMHRLLVVRALLLTGSNEPVFDGKRLVLGNDELCVALLTHSLTSCTHSGTGSAHPSQTIAGLA